VAAPRSRVQRFATRVTLVRAICLIIVAFALFTVAAGFAEYLIDRGTFKTPGDALWWAIQTVSTVGYGDEVPQSTAGRLVATAVMLFGMAFVPAVTSIIVAILVERARRGFAEEQRQEEQGAGR
jgi:voltage-gated potassium channel Kch